MILESGQNPTGKKRKQEESLLQARCFQWAWNERPITRRVLFHVENERTGSNIIDGSRRRSMGLVAGVSDLILLIARGRWHGLCIEMKTPEGHQSEEQKTWQRLVEGQGFRYEVIRSEDAFRKLIDEYLGTK